MDANRITAALLRELFDYDADRGVLTRKVTRCNRARAGSDVGSQNGDGYLTVWIDGRKQYVHRLVWLYVHGRWPRGELDHRDGDRANNRIRNLREGTHAENMQNQWRPIRSKKTCDLLGVHPSGRKWMALITVDGTQNYLGSFDTADAAHAAYLNAKRELHPFAHGR